MRWVGGGEGYADVGGRGSGRLVSIHSNYLLPHVGGPRGRTESEVNLRGGGSLGARPSRATFGKTKRERMSSNLEDRFEKKVLNKQELRGRRGTK